MEGGVAPVGSMDVLLIDRRIALWEQVCQQFPIPKARMQQLDKIIRAGEVPESKLVGRRPGGNRVET